MSARLASTVLAGSASVALSGLGPSTAPQTASPGCMQAYTAGITGCAVGDFTSMVCSTQCRRGVAGRQAAIQASCSGADAGGNAMVEQALQGRLVVVLCGGGGDVGTASSVLTVRTSSSSSVSVSSSSSIAQDVPSTTEPPTEPPTEAEVQPTPAADPSPTSSPTPKQPMGGGSPFDVVVLAAGAQMRASSAAAVVCLALGL
ncbi:hypothetical protein GQ602_001719 [Ophiocordyceps camponoti-floridani]|uniref:Extracellular membrane protein CFEM domain-containing protein n=1 Tax=Ophiocordyceps camponoti-floridani TaxID=2030778 RepID=A0A8H4Q972_9HYPO|nr:hypothetical protein GQ602_001719 [Ophiocordyceps camponoti-floridani]